MKKQSLFLTSILVTSVLAGCTGNSVEQTSDTVASVQNKVQKISYPVTHKGDVVDNYFGTEVADPYRWLEDDRSEETGAWVKAENKVTFDYLAQIPYRDQLRSRLAELWNYEKIGAPFKEGDYTYFYKNDGLQNQYVVYRQKDGAEAEVFLDPNTLSTA